MDDAEKKLIKEIQKIQQLIEDTVTKIAYQQDNVQRLNNQKKQYNQALQVLRDLK